MVLVPLVCKDAPIAALHKKDLHICCNFGGIKSRLNRYENKYESSPVIEPNQPVHPILAKAWPSPGFG